jgi:hypothetical protein
MPGHREWLGRQIAELSATLADPGLEGPARQLAESMLADFQREFSTLKESGDVCDCGTDHQQ